MTLIRGIPNEIIAHIFQHIQGDLLYKFKEVSCSWKSFIEKGERTFPLILLNYSTYIFPLRFCQIFIRKQRFLHPVKMDSCKNVCFKEITFKGFEDPLSMKAAKDLAFQNGGFVIAKTITVHFNACFSSNLFRLNREFLTNLFNCSKLILRASSIAARYILQDPEVIRIPDSFVKKIIFYLVNNEVENCLSLIFDQHAFSNRERICLDTEATSTGQNFMIKFLEGFKEAQYPEKIFQEICFHFLGHFDEWPNALQPYSISGNIHDRENQENSNRDSNEVRLNYLITRKDGWCLRIVHKYREAKEDWMTLIRGIPNEIIADIFQHIQGDLLYKLKEVSRSWKSFIEKGERTFPLIFLNFSTNIIRLTKSIHIRFQIKMDSKLNWMIYMADQAIINKSFKNVCFKEITFRSLDPLIMKAAKDLAFQNGGFIIAKTIIVKNAYLLPNLFRLNHAILTNLFNCSKLILHASFFDTKYILQNPDVIRIPDSFVKKIIFYSVDSEVENYLSLIFDQHAFSNREKICLVNKHTKATSTGQNFMIKFLKGFKEAQYPEKIFQEICFHFLGHFDEWSNALQPYSNIISGNSHDCENQDYSNEVRLNYLITRKDGWCLRIVHKYREAKEDWYFNVIKQQ